MTLPPKNAKSSVAGVIFNADRTEILLIKRRDVDIWVIPGGGVDPGEAPEAAMVREFAEETGLTVAIKRQVALFTPVNRLTNYSYLFECSILKGELTLGDETQGIGFFPLAKLPDPVFFLHRDWIEAARNPINGVNGIIQQPLSQITYFNLFMYFLTHPLQVLRMVASRCGIPLNTK